MKVPPEKLKPFSTDIAPECTKLILSLKCTGEPSEFASKLDGITEWCSIFGKTEMGRWIDVLNDCDAILETATTLDTDEMLAVDRNTSLEVPLVSVLRFTSLLFENTFSRSIYSSMERLVKLLDSNKSWVVVQTLRLIMVISKSSRFISQHLTSELRSEIYNKLTAILETWSGKLRSISFADFCSESFKLPESMYSIQIQSDMNIFTVDLNKPFAELNTELKKLVADSTLDKAEKTFVFTKLCFAYSARNQNERFYLVMARLISTSVIFYSRCLLGDDSRLNGLSSEQYIGQICAVLRFSETSSKFQQLADAVKTEAMKTLASIVFLEKAKKIQLIVDSLELKTYHGFCPTLLRDCIERLKAGKLESSGSDCSVSFVTSLFSLVYHIAGFEYGGEALNRASMTPLLLGVVKTDTLPDQYISFITRSVRIIDILTGMDVTDFVANDGTEIIVRRFTHEVEQAKKHMEATQGEGNGPSLCHQQRLALMKSLLNFLKRAVLDVNLAAQMRSIMEEELPASIIHIVGNPEYYGSSLLHCSITLATNFIYQEPAQLTMLQNKGLTDAIMSLILNKKFPSSRDLVCALPNICSALCLNERGLNELKSFQGQRPLDQIFKIIYSNKFLLSMRKRKTEILETAHLLGTSFDELIRHQPTLRHDVMNTIATILDWMLNTLCYDKKAVISWSIGKTIVEDDATEHMPLGDFLAMLGVMLETMVTNRGIQDNIQVLNECGIPIRLVKLLSQAQKPNPVLLQSNYLPNLANILCCVMRQLNKVDDAFIHLVETCAKELTGYAGFKEDAQERLYQVTRLSSLVSTLNNLMKSVMHGQSSYDIRPFLLHYFASDGQAHNFLLSLFDTYKLMSSDKLLTAAQQTTTQILEDTTKVRELLRIDDSIGDQQETPMEIDRRNGWTSAESADTLYGLNSTAIFANRRTPLVDEQQEEQRSHTTPTSSLSDAQQEEQQSQAAPSSSISNNSQQQPSSSSSNNDVNMVNQTSQTEPISINTGNATVARSGSTTTALSPEQVERAIQQVAYRCQRQIGELIACIGKNFCTANVVRARQRAHAHITPLSQDTLKKDFRKISQLVFSGVQRLLHYNESESSSISALPISQSLTLLKKLLIVDAQNIHQLLPDFYLSGCHRTFFMLADNCFRSNFAKEEYVQAFYSWLGIAQKLVSSNLMNIEAKQTRNPAQARVMAEGFEIGNYLASSQKDTFAALHSMLKAVVAHCESTATEENKEGANRTEIKNSYKLLRKLLECLKFVLADMLKLMELIEEKNNAMQEIPVSEIDPEKIQQLVDMGFSQSDAVDALLQNISVSEAAEYLVSLMERNINRQVASPPPTAATAISEPTGSPTAANSDAPRNEEEMPEEQQATSSSTTTAIEEKKPLTLTELKPLSREELQERVELVCNEIVGSCLRLISQDRCVIVGLSELVAVFVDDPLARSWVDDEFIGRLTDEVNRQLDSLTGQEENAELVGKLAALLHLFCLVWQNFPNLNIHKRVGPRDGDNTSAEASGGFF